MTLALDLNTSDPNAPDPNNLGPNNLGPNNLGPNNLGPNNLGPGAPDPTVSDPTALVRLPYPPVGGSQHLALVHLRESERDFDPRLFLARSELPETVLRSAFFPGTALLPTPLPAPHDCLPLPPLPRTELREERVRDEAGRKLGMLLSVPALFVHANQILHHQALGNDRYDYAAAVGAMVREAGRLLAGVLKRRVLRHREKPGLMAHAQANPLLRLDEVGISERFAGELLPLLRGECDLPLDGVGDLDGFPTWTVRFPLANRWGVQELTLRVLPGPGRYLAVHPFNLAHWFLGDVDGDLLLVHLRAAEVRSGRLRIDPKRAPIGAPNGAPRLQARLTLQTTVRPETGPFSPEEQEKLRLPDLRDPEGRLGAVHAADAREHVAIYTMAMGWWVSRVLALGGTEPREAYRQGYDLLQYFMERCMDARKLGADNPFTPTSGFDPYQFMETLLNGGQLDWGALLTLGVPAEALRTLQLAWALSGGNLRGLCAQSPVYYALVLQRRNLETSTLLMLRALQELGLPPGELYQALLADLQCLPGRVLSWPETLTFPEGDLVAV